MERTLSIIKPDATSRNITGKVNAMIEEAGLHIIAQKRILLTPEQAEEFYAEHKDTISSTKAPRDRSLTGAFRPCSIGP